MHEIIFESQLLKDGHLSCPKEYANPKAQFKVIVSLPDEEPVDSTQTIDLKGKLAIPGFIESHGHFNSLGYSKMQLDLMNVKNWDEVADIVKKAVSKAKPGEWIRGRGWHQEKWGRVPKPNVNGLPFHDSMSRISPENPVLLTHASGHSCFANAQAMELAGINEKTPNPDGGEIVKDENVLNILHSILLYYVSIEFF